MLNTQRRDLLPGIKSTSRWWNFVGGIGAVVPDSRSYYAVGRSISATPECLIMYNVRCFFLWGQSVFQNIEGRAE